MKNNIRISVKLCMLVLAGLVVTGNACPQERDRERTRQAQAVSKKIYDVIQAAQQEIEVENYDGALLILQRAYTELGDDAELDLRLGNAYLNLGRYAECANAIRSGLGKGGIKNPDNARISLGMCLYNQQEYRAAISAFQEARKTSRSARIADQWIRAINFDIARDEQIEHAEAASQKQLEELAKRREVNGSGQGQSAGRAHHLLTRLLCILL